MAKNSGVFCPGWGGFGTKLVKEEIAMKNNMRRVFGLYLASIEERGSWAMKSRVLLFIVVFATTASAGDWFYNISYNVAVPGRQMRPFINNTSFLGFNLDARKMVSPHASIGAAVGHQVFYWKTNEPMSLQNGFFSGTPYRFMNTIPLMVNSHYYIGNSDRIKPFVGLNAGGFYAWQRSEMGIVVMEGRRWRWGIAPEFGVIVPVGQMKVNIGTKLSYLGLPGESNLGDPQKQMFFSFNVGLAFYQD